MPCFLGLFVSTQVSCVILLGEKAESSNLEVDGVIDGTRTRDNQNHNLGLYQLSYDHQPEGQPRESQDGTSSIG